MTTKQRKEDFAKYATGCPTFHSGKCHRKGSCLCKAEFKKLTKEKCT